MHNNWPTVHLRYKVSQATFTSFYCRTGTRAFPTSIVHLLAIPDGQNLRQKLQALVYQIYTKRKLSLSSVERQSPLDRWLLRTLLMRKLLALLATIQISIERKLLARADYSWTTHDFRKEQPCNGTLFDVRWSLVAIPEKKQFLSK